MKTFIITYTCTDVVTFIWLNDLLFVIPTSYKVVCYIY